MRGPLIYVICGGDRGRDADGASTIAGFSRMLLLDEDILHGFRLATVGLGATGSMYFKAYTSMLSCSPSSGHTSSSSTLLLLHFTSLLHAWPPTHMITIHSSPLGVVA